MQPNLPGSMALKLEVAGTSADNNGKMVAQSDVGGSLGAQNMIGGPTSWQNKLSFPKKTCFWPLAPQSSSAYVNATWLLFGFHSRVYNIENAFVNSYAVSHGYLFTWPSRADHVHVVLLYSLTFFDNKKKKLNIRCLDITVEDKKNIKRYRIVSLHLHQHNRYTTPKQEPQYEKSYMLFVLFNSWVYFCKVRFYEKLAYAYFWKKVFEKQSSIVLGKLVV